MQIIYYNTLPYKKTTSVMKWYTLLRHRALYQILHVLYFTSATKIKKYLFMYIK